MTSAVDLDPVVESLDEAAHGVQTCGSCGAPTPDNFSTHDDWRCRRCSAADDEAHELAVARKQRSEWDDIVHSMSEMVETARQRFEASPHRCLGGCGEHVLRPTDLCAACVEVRRLEKERHEWLVATGIPERLRWATFSAPVLSARVKTPGAIAKAREAAVKGLDRVVLMGDAGMGKSVLASCVLRVFLDERGTGCKFFDGYEIARARANAGLGEEAPSVSAAMDANVLVFDDLGAGKTTAHDATGDVVHYRHAKQKATVITTGFTPDALEAKYGSGVARRIFEGSIVIEMWRQP